MKRKIEFVFIGILFIILILGAVVFAASLDGPTEAVIVEAMVPDRYVPGEEVAEAPGVSIWRYEFDDAICFLTVRNRDNMTADGLSCIGR